MIFTGGLTGLCAGINGIEWDAVELPSQFMGVHRDYHIRTNIFQYICTLVM